jgi:hypothetical protein
MPYLGGVGKTEDESAIVGLKASGATVRRAK